MLPNSRKIFTMKNIRPLKPALAKKANKELNEDPNNIERDIQYLKNWILKQPHLKARTTDQFLLSFLRGCKHSMERTKEKLDKYYALMASIPELYKDRDVDNPKVKEIIRLGTFLRLPQTNGEDGPRITIIRPGAYDANKYRLSEVMKIGTMIADVSLLEDDNIIIAGQIDIIDLANVTAQHFFQFEPLFLKKIAVFAEKATPLRLKGIHCVNTPPGFELIFNTGRNFLSEKNKQRLFFHGSNMESLYEYIPRKLLPVEYGGTNGTIADIVDYWDKKICEYRDYFKEDNKFGSNEKLRIGKPFNPESDFGKDGSFRTLNVD